MNKFIEQNLVSVSVLVGISIILTSVYLWGKEPTAIIDQDNKLINIEFGAGESTFGYTTVGDDQDQDVSDIIIGSVFTIPDGGIIDSISVMLDWEGTAGKKHKAAIYKHSDLSLVATTEEKTNPDTGYHHEWVVFNFSEPKPQLVSGTEYILVYWNETGWNMTLYRTSGETNQAHSQSLSYDTFPDPLIPSHSNYKYSIYATYTAVASDTCTPTLDEVWKMDLQDHCTTTASFYSKSGMECYNQSGGSWVIAGGTEVRVASSTNCIPQIEGTGVFSIQPSQ